ncbi:MAG: GIY-YIG nuclease family protein [Aquaticitalea sp.]
MSHCYILLSKTLDRFYVGACQKLEGRIQNHNNATYGKTAYTSTAMDWELFLDIKTDNFPHARRLELKIKSMKSKSYILNLKNYPELMEKIRRECT